MNDDEVPRDGDVLPPEGDEQVHSPEELNVLALISNYTDRPDLFLAEVEKHDPGFVKRMNEAARAHSEQYREERLTFGRRQAYTALSVTVFAAIALLVILGFAIWSGAGFGSIIALGIFYAITQGGPGGFGRLIDACGDAVRRFRSGSEDDR